MYVFVWRAVSTDLCVFSGKKGYRHIYTHINAKSCDTDHVYVETLLTGSKRWWSMRKMQVKSGFAAPRRKNYSYLIILTRYDSLERTAMEVMIPRKTRKGMMNPGYHWNAKHHTHWHRLPQTACQEDIVRQQTMDTNTWAKGIQHIVQMRTDLVIIDPIKNLSSTWHHSSFLLHLLSLSGA